MRSNPAVNGQTQLVCADGISPELNFDTVGNLSMFDFNKMQVFPSHDSVAFGRQPIQLCRATVSQSGVVKALTSLFELQFNHTPLAVVPLALHSRGQSAAAAELQTAVAGAPVVFGEYRIQNDGTAPRMVRVQKANLTVRTYSIHILQSVHMITRPFVALAIKPGPTAALADEGGSYKIQVPPKGYFDIAVAFKAAAAAQCPAPNRLPNPIVSLVLEPAQTLNLDEITETNRALSQTPIDLGPRIYLGTTAANAARFNLIFRGEHSQCGW